MTGPDGEELLKAVPDSILPVPEIRDYQRINAELVARLDQGQTFIRLSGVEGQRLLVAGLQGPWTALVEVEGDAGPELAAGLNAPGLTVVVTGSSADGTAAGLRAGRLICNGPAGDLLGARQEAGSVLALAGAGHRAGLAQSGGVLVVLGTVGRLAGERQSGGRFYAVGDQLGPYAGHGHRGGTLIRLTRPPVLEPGAAADPDLPHEDAEILRSSLAAAGTWIAHRRVSIPPV
jgi:glutamate synthase domain-containing protein 3